MSNETEILAEAPPPDAALEFWKQRAKLTDQEVKALGEGAKKRAFYVSGLAQKDLVTTVSDGIEAALQNGETLADFKKRIAGVIKSQGWHSRRVEVIFRTNMQTAYAAGRYKKMQAVKRLRPYWQYVAVMDKRVRPNHAVLDGLVYPADHEFWDSNYPPNGFRCRCGVRTLSQRQVDKEGLTVQQNMPKDCVWTDKEGMQHFVHFPGADKGFKGNVGKDWLDGLDKNAIKPPQPAKAKKSTSQKALKEDIAAVSTLIDAVKDPQAAAVLHEKKAALEAALEAKKASSAKGKLSAQASAIKAKIDDFPAKTYTGIWVDSVTTADWITKAPSIPAKKIFYEKQLASGLLDAEKIAQFKQYLKDLDEFDIMGKQLYALYEEEKKILAALPKPKISAKDKKNPYSQARKDAALLARTGSDADVELRAKSAAIWKKATEKQRDAMYNYTRGSGGYNRPLRGHDRTWGNYIGRGKVSLDNEGQEAAIKHLTKVISKSSYDRDVWLQRGVETTAGVMGLFGLKRSDMNLSPEKLYEKLSKCNHTDHAFLSCGSSVGAGFSGYTFRIYCPKGTKMLYAEPFSHYGNGGGRNWDGESPQKTFSSEDETIIQRGTTFRVTKVSRDSSGRLAFEMEVVEQIEV